MYVYISVGFPLFWVSSLPPPGGETRVYVGCSICGTQSGESTAGTSRETWAGRLKEAWGPNSGRKIGRIGQFMGNHSPHVALKWGLGSPAGFWAVFVRARCLGEAVYSPQFPLHVWASVEPLLSSCEQRNARCFISCEQGSKLPLPVLTVRVNQDPSLQGHSSYYPVHAYVLFTMALQDHCFTGPLVGFFFFWHVPCKPRILLLFNLIHKHFFLLLC